MHTKLFVEVVCHHILLHGLAWDILLEWAYVVKNIQIQSSQSFYIVFRNEKLYFKEDLKLYFGLYQ